jgi:hypothetical protein
MVHLSGCSAVSCHLTVYTKFRTPSFQVGVDLTVGHATLQRSADAVDEFKSLKNLHIVCDA